MPCYSVLLKFRVYVCVHVCLLMCMYAYMRVDLLALLCVGGLDEDDDDGAGAGDVVLCPHETMSVLRTLQVYPAHASHVLGVRFTNEEQFVLSIGGEDNATFQWRFAE
jgi:hypothetical protein